MRKKGFSLVELLIVLAVMAALIATITPVALNAIRKAKATQVAQNLKTLASAFENMLYVEGRTPTTISSLARDIDDNKYGIAWAASSGTYTVVVWAIGEVSSEALTGVLSDAHYTSALKKGLNDIASVAGFTPTQGFVPTGNDISSGTAYYTFTVAVY